MRRYILLLVIILVLGGESLPGKEASQVFVLSSSLDYFSTFLEVHLRRLLSPSQVHLVPLSHLEELPGDFPQEGVSLVVFWGEGKYFSPIWSQIPRDRKILLLWGEEEGIDPPLEIQYCKIRIEGKSVIEALKEEVVEKLFPDNNFTIWSVGEVTPSLRRKLDKEFSCRFRETEENNKEVLEQLISKKEKSLIIAGNAEVGKQLINELSGVEVPPPIVVLEASPEMLFALLQGKIKAVVDFKPSQLAQEIMNLINCLYVHKSVPEFITIYPRLILSHNIKEADGYEVIARCLMCQ
ncbi:MAG: hypothetical protein PWP57_722 [Candidatus Atribacteria bacterium]|nr:hypothetical protein [Candidatus Atribacteria bacterium]